MKRNRFRLSAGRAGEGGDNDDVANCWRTPAEAIGHGLFGQQRGGTGTLTGIGHEYLPLPLGEGWGEGMIDEKTWARKIEQNG